MPRTSTTIETRSSKSPQIPPAISYRLSEKYFLDLGWTTKPNISLAFPVVVMKAKFAHPIISPWFQERDHILRKSYPNGRKLFLARPDGTGKIFYPNGKVAVKIEKGGINQFRTRVWVYSSGEVDWDGEKHPPQLCALFDSLGNGVVYDYRMTKRLVYNQREGILWDSPNGIPIAWKWHDIKYTGSLTVINEEDDRHSLLQEVPKPVIFAASADLKTGSWEKELKKSNKSSPQTSPSVLSTKLTKSEINFREQFEHSRYLDTARLHPKVVTPVKPIVLALNKYLALRILSQSEISLNFFAKSQQTTLRIGVLYNPYDKLKVVEIDDPSIALERVLCPFESFPANTKSMFNFRKVIQSVRLNSCKHMERTFRGVIRRSMSLAQARTMPKDVSSSKIRKAFIDFFCEENKHLFIRSSPVFSLLDPTLAFVNAGMNQFKDVFLGLVQPASTRITNSQKCIRILGKHNDLHQVGQDGTHHTFFEMLGNWSFGDYFKEDACRMAWDLLTNVYGIAPERLYVTYYEGDMALGVVPDLEVREIWRQIGVKENHILPFGTRDNFWEGGISGPCGPCTEIHYDTVPGRTDAGSLVNTATNEIIELWNLVFTQYNRKPNGELENLKNHFVDTGMGFERLVAVLQDKATNYDTDLFLPLFEAIRKHTGHSGYTGKYDGNTVDCSYRILADHSRMLAVALADGMLPKRQVRVRAVLKKALYMSEKVFRANESLLKELTSHVADIFSDAYPEVGRNLFKIHLIIDSEAELMKAQRNSALDQWSRMEKRHQYLKDFDILQVPQLLDGVAYVEKNILKQGKFVVTGEDVWVLFDTYGVPPQVTEQLALKLNLSCDMASFEEKKLSEKNANRELQSKRFLTSRSEIPYSDVLIKLEEKGVQPTLDYFKYDYRPDATGKYIFKQQPTTVEAIIRGNELLNEISLRDIEGEEEIGLVLDRTQFFVKEGSQADDRGTLKIENGIVFDIKRLTKLKNFIIHFGSFTSFPRDAKVTVEDIGVLEIDENRRLRIMRNHTALHILNAAVRSLTPIVMEKSSTAQPEKLTLNFLVNDSSLHPMDDIKKVEGFVREFILHGVSVRRKILDHAQFQVLSDVVFVPGEPIVKLEIPVVEINSGFKLSKEYCSGTHLLNTSDLKDFVVTKFRKGSYGVQEIEAVTGDGCLEVRSADSEHEKEWSALLEESQKCDELSEVPYLLSKMKKLRLSVHTCKKMSHIGRLKLESEIKAVLDNLRLLKRSLLAREIQKASETTSETFVIYSFEKDSDFHLLDLESIKNCQNKPLMLVLKRDDLASIRCYVPQRFVSGKFSAEKWLLDTMMPFGGIGYHETNENADLSYASQERKFTEKQLNQLLELASDIARENVES